MNTVGECVGRMPPATSPPRGETAPPSTVMSLDTAFTASYVRGEEALVGRRRRVGAVVRELRQPVAVEVRLVADDHDLQLGHRRHD